MTKCDALAREHIAFVPAYFGLDLVKDEALHRTGSGGRRFCPYCKLNSQIY